MLQGETVRFGVHGTSLETFEMFYINKNSSSFPLFMGLLLSITHKHVLDNFPLPTEWKGAIIKNFP